MDYSQHTTDELKEMLSSIFKHGKADSKIFEFFRKQHAIWLIKLSRKTPIFRYGDIRL